jgi:hypothetical protein
MPFLPSLPKLTEGGWKQRLVSTSQKAPGLAVRYGWRTWHDRATNAPRACPKCHAKIDLPRNDPGWPDLFLLRGQTLYVVELKSDRGEVTPAQREWLEAFRQVRRIRVAVWRPRMLAKIEELLRDERAA